MRRKIYGKLSPNPKDDVTCGIYFVDPISTKNHFVDKRKSVKVFMLEWILMLKSWRA